MSGSKTPAYPPLYKRLYSVWFRHMRVYTRHLLSNGFPPFLEPLIFLAGIGLGLGTYIDKMDGVPYIEYLGAGLLVTAAMWTAAFECSYGTFIRLEFEKVYDGMLAAPLTAENLIVGEIIWAGTKGLFFSFAVLCILTLFNIVQLPNSLITPLIGFFTGVMFGTLSLLVTSFVKTINHFNFYMTGLISPMFFFSGVVFPTSKLPPFAQPIAELLPLTHSVRLVRAVCNSNYHADLLLDMLYIAVFILVVGYFAVKRLKKRLIY
jgi:lipooligosaccharide transport system permease protein